MQRIVILATGTDVGKTYFACQLLRALAEGAPLLPTLGVKPLETGIPDDPAAPSREFCDAALLRDASSAISVQERLHFRAFPAAISPHRAARLAGTEVTVSELVNWVEDIEHRTTLRCPSIAPTPSERRRLATPSVDSTATGWLIVETAGGVFSPINASQTNYDLARALDPAHWILLAPDRLGVLHDLRSTYLACNTLGRSPDTLLLNAPAIPDSSTGTNAAELTQVGLPAALLTLARNETTPLGTLTAHLANRPGELPPRTT